MKLRTITYQSADGNTIYECTTPILNAALTATVWTVKRIETAVATMAAKETYAYTAAGNMEYCHPATDLDTVEALFA